MVSHTSANFGRHKHCGSGDIMVSFSHVTSQDPLIQGSCDFMGGTHSCWS